MFSLCASWGSHFPKWTNEPVLPGAHLRAYGVPNTLIDLNLRRFKALEKLERVFHKPGTAKTARTAGKMVDIGGRTVLIAFRRDSA